MVIDDFLEFADAVSVAAAAGTALIGDVVDLGTASPQRDIGNGEETYFVVTVDTAIITGGAAGTVQFLLVSDAQAAIATDGSATVHYASRAFTTGALAATQATAGKTMVAVALPREGPVYERYLGVLVVTATTTTTAGAINAFINLDPAGNKAYARAVQ